MTVLALALIPTAVANDADPPACPKVAPLLDKASAAMVELELDTASSRLAAADRALEACHEVYDASTLGQLWLLEGVMAILDGKELDAADAFRASGRVAPDAWKDVFGPAVRAQYEASMAETAPSGALQLQPDLGGNRAFLDGEEFDANPHSVESGLHALQISDPTGVVMFSQLLWVPPDDTLRLETGVPTAAVAVAGPDQAPRSPLVRERKKVDPLLVGGIGAIVVGGASLALSLERADAMDDAEDWKSLQSRYREHGVTRVAGVGLILAGGAAVGMSFAF